MHFVVGLLALVQSSAQGGQQTVLDRMKVAYCYSLFDAESGAAALSARQRATAKSNADRLSAPYNRIVEAARGQGTDMAVAQEAARGRSASQRDLGAAEFYMLRESCQRLADDQPAPPGQPPVTAGRGTIPPVTAPAAAASSFRSPEWMEPYPPYRIADNLYYIGTRGLATFLVTTPHGHILINSDLEENVPAIRTSVEQLGFKFTDIKVLLISHAHWDHDAGSAMIKRLTGAQYMVMDADVPVVETGGKLDFHYGAMPGSYYPVAKVDRVLHDGDEVKLGNATLVARLTPGHTKGTTTWTMKVSDGGKSYNAVIVGSPNANAGYKLVNNAAYPQIAADFEKMFTTLKALPCDIFLGAHGSYFNMEAKYARMRDGAPAAFVDPDGYKAFVAEREQAFRAELAKQKASPAP